MKHLLFLPFTFLFLTFFSQQNEEGYTAKEHILRLKKSALLVRLKTKENSIRALKDRGFNDKAAQVESDQKKKNLELIQAFNKYYNFSNVYFFYSSDSKKVENGELDSVVFLNDSLEPDPSIKVKEIDYYTSEIGLIQPDSTVYNDKNSVQNTENGAEQKPTYSSGGAGMSFQALIIKDDKFRQLASPFPFYSRTLSSLPFKRPYSVVVKKLNAKLEEYYRRVMKMPKK